MSNMQPYVPYVPGKKNQGRPQQQQAYQPSAYPPPYNPSAGGGGATQPVVVQATAYNPASTAPTASSSPYAPASSASSYAPSSGSSSVYTPISSTTTTATSSPYAPAPAATSTGSSSAYAPISSTTATATSSPYAPAPAATATSVPPPAAKSTTLPPFSMALDVPPPPAPRDPTPPMATASVVQPSAPSSYSHTTATSSYSSSTTSQQQQQPAYGVPTKPPLAGSTTSANYNGLPTGGLVSEGNPVKCHKVDYEIKGTSTQLVEIQLDPGETVIAEAGAMMFLEDDIDFKAKFGDGSNPSQGFFGKLGAGLGRIMTGESLFITHFTNKGSSMPQRVAFAAPYPGTILPINLADIGESITCQKDAFLCAAFGTKISIAFNKRIGSGFFGGEGFILQKLQGDGMAFIHAGGHVIRRELRGDRIRLDTGCLVAFTSGITYDITMVKGLKSMFFGGEGLFLATLKGTGTVWIQSLPFSRMADRIIMAAGSNKGEGTPLTFGLGDVVDGDGIGGGMGFGGF